MHASAIIKGGQFSGKQDGLQCRYFISKDGAISLRLGLEVGNSVLSLIFHKFHLLRNSRC